MSTATAVEYDMAELLQRAECTLRGRNRADCVWCKGRRTISCTDEVYFCHRCKAKGSAFTLARGLGVARRLSPAEARALRLERERAEAAARAFLVRVRGARFGLSAIHIELLNLQDRAHECLKTSRDDEIAWEALACVYGQLPRVSAELLLLSEGTIGERVAWLEADEVTRREMVDRILLVGGVPTFDDKWVGVG